MGLLDGFLGKDWQDPQSQAVMALAGGLLSGNFGQGAKDYGNILAGAKDTEMKRQMLKLQMDDIAAQAGLRSEQANQMKAKAAQEQRIQSIIAGAGKVRPGMGGTDQVNAALPPEMQIGAQPALQQAGQIDYLDLIRQGVPFERVKELASAGDLGKSEVARVQEVEGPNGQKVLQGFDKFGRPVDQGVNGYTAPQLVNLANRQVFVKPSAGMSMEMGQSPDSKASNALGWANNALANRKFAFDQAGGSDAGGTTQMALNKQFGKPQAGYRWKADGSMEFIPGGPADQKAQLKTSGEGTVDSVVADLRDKYQKLNDGGGIVNNENGTMTNLAARLGSTGLGQTFGSAVGTKNQTSRENIEMTRPLLLQAIMKATGMSAKQMDSNAELKLYLATATDPTKGFQANQDALNRIEMLYGSGQKAGGAKPQAMPKNAPTMRWNPKTNKIEMVN